MGCFEFSWSSVLSVLSRLARLEDVRWSSRLANLRATIVEATSQASPAVRALSIMGKVVQRRPHYCLDLGGDILDITKNSQCVVCRFRCHAEQRASWIVRDLFLGQYICS
jgi:hypothetical protein